MHSYLFLATQAAVPAARRAGVRAVVVSQRSSYDATVAPPWRWLARRCTGVPIALVNSQAALREEQAAGLPADRLLYVPNGIAEAPPAVSREALGLPAGARSSRASHTSAGRRATGVSSPPGSAVRERLPTATLVLAGDGPLRARLETFARESGVDGSLHFLGRRDDARQIVAAADLVVLASDTEGMPNAVLEAMAAGRAVVATRVGGLPDLVADGKTGVLVPPRDARALAEAMAALLQDHTRRAAFGDAARARAREHFSMEAVTRATAAVYDALLERRSHPRVHVIAGQFWRCAVAPRTSAAGSPPSSRDRASRSRSGRADWSRRCRARRSWTRYR